MTPVDFKDIEAFKAYLTEMLGYADKTVTVEGLGARIWLHFLPHALSLYTTAGVLERIASEIAEPSEGDQDEDEDADE
jgi:hypothetical protein